MAHGTTPHTLVAPRLARQVLAEAFFAPTYLRMLDHYQGRNATGAAHEQRFKLAAMGAIGEFGGAFTAFVGLLLLGGNDYLCLQ